MKANYILGAALVLGTLSLSTSCENYFDEKYMGNGDPQITDVRKSMTYTMTADDVAAIGKQCTYKGKDTIPSVYEQKALSLCTESDSSAYTEWKRIASLKAFTEDASPDIYVPMFMAQKFPYLDAGTMCNVTYPLYEGKSERVEPFMYSTPYTLTEDDYRAIWNGRGASYLTEQSEEKIPAFLTATFPLAPEGKIIVLSYDFKDAEPDSIIPFLPYECTVGQLLEAEEKQEHQLTGIVTRINNLLQTFYLVDGSDEVIVYNWNEEHKGALKNHGIKEGDNITIQGKLTFNSEGTPQIIDAKYVSHTPAGGNPAPFRVQRINIEEGVKTVVYQLRAGKWVEYDDERLYSVEVLPQSIYTALENTQITNADKIIGDYLRRNYPYALEKQIYMVVYSGSKGYTADEWTYDGTDFVMNTGYIEEVMSFVRNDAWVANISTYYTTPFVNDGPADFTLHTVALDGLSYIWRYQAAYGMTATAPSCGRMARFAEDPSEEERAPGADLLPCCALWRPGQ